MYRRLNVHRLMERAYLSLPTRRPGQLVRRAHEIVEAIEAGDVDAGARGGARERRDREAASRIEAIELAGGVL